MYINFLDLNNINLFFVKEKIYEIKETTQLYNVRNYEL